MQFVSCPSEATGFWLAEKKKEGACLEVGAERCSCHLPMHSSLKLRILQPFVSLNEKTIKGTEQLKKKCICAVKTADWVFWQPSLPHPYLLPGCFQEVISSPPFPLGDRSACPILGCAHLEIKVG